MSSAMTVGKWMGAAVSWVVDVGKAYNEYRKTEEKKRAMLYSASPVSFSEEKSHSRLKYDQEEEEATPQDRVYPYRYHRHGLMLKRYSSSGSCRVCGRLCRTSFRCYPCSFVVCPRCYTIDLDRHVKSLSSPTLSPASYSRSTRSSSSLSSSSARRKIRSRIK